MLTFPNLTKRLTKGSPLTFAEGDANLDNIKAFCLSLASVLETSLNADGTLLAGSVGSKAIQSAAVTLAALNPSLLYSIVPVDADTGSLNAYAITAHGGLGGANLVIGATYDSNGNYTLTGLKQNYTYYWTQTGDLSCVVDSVTTLSASGQFVATNTSVVLTGAPNASVSASVVQVAPISSYKDGQLFIVSTSNANTGPATLAVNGLPAIAIYQNGSPLTSNAIGASSVFMVVYSSATGRFVLVSGGGSGGTGSVSATTNYTFNSTNVYASGLVSLPGSGLTSTFAHGLAILPTAWSVQLKKIAGAVTGPAIGEIVPSELFQISGVPAFTLSVDATYITVSQGAGTITLGGNSIATETWQLMIVATSTSNVNNIIFPALSFDCANIDGAFAYGKYLFPFTYKPNLAKSVLDEINLTTNRIINLASSSTAQRAVNGAVMTRASGAFEFLYTSTDGIYRFPVVSPLASVVPSYATYNLSGTYSLTVLASTTYTYTQGTNDTGWYNGSSYVTTSPITTGIGQTSLTLRGNPGGVVTAGVSVSGATWAPTKLAGFPASYQYKPVWMVETSGTPTFIYIGGNSYGWSGNTINAVELYCQDSSGGSVQTARHLTGTPTLTNFDFTNGSIVNIAEFNAWTGAASRVLMLQYNPISQRIYLITSESATVHVFQITGNTGFVTATGSYTTSNSDIVNFWQSSGRYSNLTYLKSIMIGGIGTAWGDSNYCHYTIEVDQLTGLEKSIVSCRHTGGVTDTITRTPWVEG